MDVTMSRQPQPSALPSINTNNLGNNSGIAGYSGRHSQLDTAAGTIPSQTMPKLENFLPDMMNNEESIDLGRIRLERRPQQLPPSVRNMAEAFRSKSGRSNMAGFPARFDPLPFQSQFFKSSTLLKMIPVPRRHQDTFVAKAASLGSREKPVIIHSERYNYSDPLRPGFDRMSQRDRIVAEQDYTHRLKLQKRAREMLPHRESRDLLMGGRPVPFAERFDIKDELRRLKAIVLPVNARELYHGKGINLPENHSSIKPRKAMPPPKPFAVSPDLEEAMVQEAVLFSHSKTSLDGLKGKRKMNKGKNSNSKSGSNKPDNPGRSNTMPTSGLPPSRPPQLSRRSTDSNLGTIATVPEDEVFSEMAPEDSADRLVSRSESVRDSTFITTERPRAESEMDIILAPDAEETTPDKSVTPRMAKAPTPNPLKAADLSQYSVSEEEMKKVFQKLDTDQDGHLLYQQVEPQFPTSINNNQKRYLKQIYDITSASTFFGVKEFVTLSCLSDEISCLDNDMMLDGFAHLNFTTLTTIVIQFTELFQEVDRAGRGKINIDSLQDIISTALHRPKTELEYGLSHLRSVLQLDGNDVNKVKFIAGIPFYLTVASLKPPPAYKAELGEANPENS